MINEKFIRVLGISIKIGTCFFTILVFMQNIVTACVRVCLVRVFKNCKLLFKNICGNTCGWKSLWKCVKCCLKTENGCLKTQTKHPLSNFCSQFNLVVGDIKTFMVFVVVVVVFVTNKINFWLKERKNCYVYGNFKLKNLVFIRNIHVKRSNLYFFVWKYVYFNFK